jgi:N-acetylglucosaminyl-diphospho-decaprenol L-rhamnosyltransferase
MSCLGRFNVVIVNYCTPDLVLNCVNSIVEFGVAAENDIIVVDSASPDDSYDRLSVSLKNVQLVRTDRNAGFGAAVNLGAARCDKDSLMVLNPDTYFVDDSTYLAADFLQSQPQVAIVGLDLVSPGGARQYSSRRFYSVMEILGRRMTVGRYWPLKARVDHHLMITSWESGIPFEAEWVVGTGFLIRRDVYEKIGGIDESYFLYMEDVDLCARIWKAGYRVACVPGALLVHDHQRASIAGPFSPAGRMHLRSLMRFRQKFKLPIFNPPGVQGIVRSSSAR